MSLRGKPLFTLSKFSCIGYINSGDIMFYYFNLFFLCSFLGYLLETFLKTFVFHSMNNGILFGPWIPVYGFGAIIVVIVLRFVFQQVFVSKIIKIITTLLIVMVLVTLLEWIGGNLIEWIFHKVYWDYSSLKFNFGHYISLEISLLWGLFSLLFIYLIKPLEDVLIKKIPKWVTISVSVIFIADAFLTYFLA